MKIRSTTAAAALLALATTPLAQASGEELVRAECAGCHALEEPDFAAQGIRERIERRGPLLFYAGNKYRREWLVDWLQDPQRIRLAGIYPPAAATPGEEFDEIDPSTLVEHPSLDAEEASAAADFLMTLTPRDALIEASDYEPGSIAARMGELNFTKFNGCDGCHSDGPGYGGVSGPELFTAWQRLQPRFIASYITNPVAWDPHTLMPAGDLNDSAVERLANYLKLIGEEDQ